MVMGLSLSAPAPVECGAGDCAFRTQRRERKIAALDAGADDYLSKPFGIANCRPVCASLYAATPPPPRPSAGEIFRCYRRFSRPRDSPGEEEVHLTPIEFRLLAVLLNMPGKCSPSASYSIRCGGQTRRTQSLFAYLYGTSATKTGTGPARPRHFITETGIGYRFMP